MVVAAALSSASGRVANGAVKEVEQTSGDNEQPDSIFLLFLASSIFFMNLHDSLKQPLLIRYLRSNLSTEY